ncbi:MAG: hypothetical protein ACTSXG_04180 [Alphaproteobacteria bacterium]
MNLFLIKLLQNRYKKLIQEIKESYDKVKLQFAEERLNKKNILKNRYEQKKRGIYRNFGYEQRAILVSVYRSFEFIDLFGKIYKNTTHNKTNVPPKKIF